MSLTTVSRKTSIFQEDCARGEKNLLRTAGPRKTSSRRLKCLANHIAQRPPRPGADALTVYSGIGSFQVLALGPRCSAPGTRLPSLPRGLGSSPATRKWGRWRLLGDVEAALGGSDSRVVSLGRWKRFPAACREGESEGTAVAPVSGIRREERLREGARAWKALAGRSERARAPAGVLAPGGTGQVPGRCSRSDLFPRAQHL